MLALNIENLYKRYDTLSVLDDVSLTVEVGELVTLVGPSGCGKSTIFNILAGLEKADAGTISIHGKPTLTGQCAYMPQRDALLPWRTVLDNVILGLELQGVKKNLAYSQALPLFADFGLSGFEASYPFELSGGMRQRAALLRTVLTGREIMLLDEPFGALDAFTRASLQTWLLTLQANLKRTILFITHDIEEAILLSDKIYILSHRPARIILAQTVDLARPRSSINLAFVELKARLLQTLQAEGVL